MKRHQIKWHWEQKELLKEENQFRLNPEDLKLVKTYPFEEGRNISKIPAKPPKKPIVYTENELKYIEELRQISMEEFDKADEQKEVNEKAELQTEAKKTEEPEIKKEQPSIYKNVQKLNLERLSYNTRFTYNLLGYL